jgi:hypothetical protein
MSGAEIIGQNISENPHIIKDRMKKQQNSFTRPATHSNSHSNNNNKQNDIDFLTPRQWANKRIADKEDDVTWHNSPNNVQIKEVNAEEKIYKTIHDGVTNYAKVILDHNQDNNTNTTYIIDVGNKNKFDDNIVSEEDLNNALNALNAVSKGIKIKKSGGKKRNTNKINKKSKKHQIKYKRNTKKSKK